MLQRSGADPGISERELYTLITFQAKGVDSEWCTCRFEVEGATLGKSKGLVEPSH